MISWQGPSLRRIQAGVSALMAARLIRALVTALLGLCIFALVYRTVAPNYVTTYLDALKPTSDSRGYLTKLFGSREGEDGDSTSGDNDVPTTKDGKSVAKAKPESGRDIVMQLLDDPIPRRDFSRFASKPPMYTKEPSQFAYATLLCTREPDMRDPFFAATQSLVWRLLWSDWRGHYPVIVFVCPFIPEEQRVVLRGQGAIVKEIGLLDDIVPAERVPLPRWRDQFTKLNMWKETEYDMIAYLDVDAFPVANIDDVFTIVPKQTCDRQDLSEEDVEFMKQNGKAGEEMCNYNFAGVDPYGMGEINGGVLIFKPDMLMHEKLLRGARKIDEYDLTKMEQGLLHSILAFGQEGAFKAHLLPQAYNAVPDYYIRHREGQVDSSDEPLRVIHDKMWSGILSGDRPELTDRWALDWMSLCRFYDGGHFEDARTAGRMKDNLELFLESMAQKEED